MDIRKLLAESRTRHEAGELVSESENIEKARLNKIRQEQQKQQEQQQRQAANQQACLELADFWVAVAGAMIRKNPEPDKVVIDEEGLEEIDRINRNMDSLRGVREFFGGGMYPGHFSTKIAKRRLVDVARRHATPAWDMMADISKIYHIGGLEGDSDYDELRSYRLYLAGDGSIRYGGWFWEVGETDSFSSRHNMFELNLDRSPVIRPGHIFKDNAPQYSRIVDFGLHMYAGVQRYKEIAGGLANLAVKYELSVDM